MADARRMGKMELFAHFADKFDMKRTPVRDLFEELLRLSEKELKRSGEFVLPGMCKLVVQQPQGARRPQPGDRRADQDSRPRPSSRPASRSSSRTPSCPASSRGSALVDGLSSGFRRRGASAFVRTSVAPPVRARGRDPPRRQTPQSGDRLVRMADPVRSRRHWLRHRRVRRRHSRRATRPEDRRRRTAAVARRHLPELGLHPDEGAARARARAEDRAGRRRVGHQLRQERREAGDRHGARPRAQEQDRHRPHQGRRVPVQEKQDRVDQRHRPAGRQGAGRGHRRLATDARGARDRRRHRVRPAQRARASKSTRSRSSPATRRFIWRRCRSRSRSWAAARSASSSRRSSIASAAT